MDKGRKYYIVMLLNTSLVDVIDPWPLAHLVMVTPIVLVSEKGKQVEIISTHWICDNLMPKKIRLNRIKSCCLECKARFLKLRLL